MEIINRIQQLLKEKKLEEAETLLEKNKKELNYDDYQAYKGLCLELKGKYEEALTEYYKIQYVGERISPKFYHFHIAICLNSLGKPKQALANLVEIEHYLSKKEITLHYQFYISYNMLGEEEKALEHIAAICKVKKDPFYQIRYANLLNNLGFFEEAYKIEKKIEKRYPDEPFLIREISSSSYNLENYKEAKIYLEKLIELKEATDWDYIYLANIQILEENYPEAKKMLSHTKEKNAYVYTKYAYCETMLGKEKKAVSYYERAVTEDPKNIIGIVSFSGYYRSRQKYEEALEVLKKYQKKNPEYKGRILYEIAKVESDREEYKKAIAYLKKAEKIEEHPLILCDLAWNYKQLEKYEEEKEYLERAKERLTGDSWVLMELGSCLLQLNQFQEALSNFKQVDLRNPEMDSNRYFYEVGFCNEMLGHFEEAVLCFQNVQGKESYTYGHLLHCCYALDKIEEMKNWARKIDFSKETDPWFLELYLEVLSGEGKYQEMELFLEEKKKILPSLLYLKKKVEVSYHLSQNKEDLRLLEALKNQQKIQEIEKENSENILWEGAIRNRLHQVSSARECLERSKKLGEKSYQLERELIYNKYISNDKKKIKKALLDAKELYQNTKKAEDLFLIAIGEYKEGHYLRTLHTIKKIKAKKEIKEIETLKGICYYKVGHKSYGRKILKPQIEKEEKSDLLEEFLKEIK